MSIDIRTVKDMNGLIAYLANKLEWKIDLDDFEDIEDITYDFSAEDIGLKEEAFAKITSLRQLPPLVDGQKWGIFCIEFDSKRFEITALRKILSGLVPKRRNAVEHAVWKQKDLLFICFWGNDNERTIGLAHFEDADAGLPQIKMISCCPAVEDFTQIGVFENRLNNLKWPVNYLDHERWQSDWSSAFVTGYRQTIKDSSTLTVQLAAEAQEIKKRILDILDIETSNGYVHLLYEKFKNTLIHDMTESQFADMYAQTVVYGLFSARCMDKTQDDFSAAEAIELIPNTNPFLKSLMKECLGSQNDSKLSFDELEIGNVVELLLHTKTDAIIQDFNRQTGGGREDPVIHFYEEFLTAYDKSQKVQRGVFYTPQPVVKFIVNAVDYIIKNEFGYEDGLASTDNKTIKYIRDSKRTVNGTRTKVEDTKEVPAIQILDPATGTGTFLRETILRIYENFKNKNRNLSPEELKRKWNVYVPEHLLPRINGFELMMAPYAVAHMKLAMVLKDTGYDFNYDERLRVYLTNTLEKPGNSNGQLALWDDPLASESIAANQVKKNEGINIVIGNPPYNGGSANKNEWILNLIDEYRREPGGKERLKEIKTHIDNDYIKFIRYAQKIIEKSGRGVVAYINPRDYLYSPTFRGMRWNLLSFFDEIYILDLNGDLRQNRNSINSDADDNVFDIQVGVCVELMIKCESNPKRTNLAKVYHYELKGNRVSKFDFLNTTSISDIPFEELNFGEPFYSFKPQFISQQLLDQNFSLDDLFIKSVNGIQTGRDTITIQSSFESMKDTINQFASGNEEAVREKFKIGKDGRDWKIKWAQNDILNNFDDKNITPILYRPFDIKWTYYTGPKGKGFLQCPRGTVMQGMVNTNNYALIIGRQGQAVGNIEWCLAFVSHGMPTDLNLFYRGGGMVFPLYLLSDCFDMKTDVPNINKTLANKIAEQLNAKYIEQCEKNTDDTNFISPEDLMNYVYAILFSRKYRQKYSKLLMIDFPKIPYPRDYDYFKQVVQLGAQLIAIHTVMQKTNKYKLLCKDDCENTDMIDKYKYENNKIWVNDSQYFLNVSEYTWNYYIGGYQPLQKWLKDRKGQKINQIEISHYGSMISSIDKTIEITQKIDEVVSL